MKRGQVRVRHWGCRTGKLAASHPLAVTMHAKSALGLVLCAATTLSGCQMLHNQRHERTGGTTTTIEPPNKAESGNAESANAWQRARGNGMAFRGVGKNPSWQVTVEKSRSPALHVTLNNARQQLDVPGSTASQGRKGNAIFAGRSNDGMPVKLRIERGQCHDADLGKANDAGVTLTVDGHDYTGCGRFLFQ